MRSTTLRARAVLVRIYLESKGCNNGLFGLLAHQQADRAVVAMLDDPAKSWTLDELAARADPSRASLVRMFRRIAQLTPLTFLTELRLDLARCKLSTAKSFTSTKECSRTTDRRISAACKVSISPELYAGAAGGETRTLSSEFAYNNTKRFRRSVA
jgi:AraC-like DNA-binding protein